MVRTRDFILFLLTVLFLVVAIGVTEVWQHWQGGLSTFADWWQGSAAEVDYRGEAPAVPDTRADRLAYLRERLRDLDLTLVAPQPDPGSDTAAPVATTTPTTPAVVAVNTCSGYRAVSLPWAPQTILQENREGMRVYYERGLPDPALPAAAPELIRARLPLRTWPGAATACIPSDVIGIALDGSLIRNHEQTLYAVFGASTLIGYALDGFPIYGGDPALVVDACGGVVVGGQYRYVVDGDRPGVITCFAGTPSTLQ